MKYYTMKIMIFCASNIIKVLKMTAVVRSKKAGKQGHVKFIHVCTAEIKVIRQFPDRSLPFAAVLP